RLQGLRNDDFVETALQPGHGGGVYATRSSMRCCTSDRGRCLLRARTRWSLCSRLAGADAIELGVEVAPAVKAALSHQDQCGPCLLQGLRVEGGEQGEGIRSVERASGVVS